jgi:acyl-CoA thioester hydrolase
MSKKDIPQRSDYPYLKQLTTRWIDNDIYGHVNNAHYFSYFDSVINEYLIKEGGLDIRGGAVIGLMVSSQCEYFGPLSYPQVIEIGLRTEHIGNSSVTYGVAAFSEGEEDARAAGSMTHVFVDRTTSKPTPVPAPFRRALQTIYRAAR